MKRLPLSRIEEIEALQTNYNIVMGRLQEELKKNFDQFNQFLNEEGLAILPAEYTIQEEKDNITIKFEEWKIRSIGKE